MQRLSEDIRITGIDIPKCHAVPDHPRVQRIYLILSDLPCSDWQTIFLRECGVTRQTLSPEARIEGSFILLDCIPEELEQNHLEYLKEDVKNTNTQFRLLLTQRQEEALRQLQEEQAAKERLQGLQNRLTFDECHPL
jgi:hypothetical protein